MSAHTPGPWEWYTSNSYNRLGTKDAYRELVYAVKYHDGHVGIEWKNDADARLLAEAPELSAFVRSFLTWYHTPGLDDRVALASAAQTARALIFRIDGVIFPIDGEQP